MSNVLYYIFYIFVHLRPSELQDGFLVPTDHANLRDFTVRLIAAFDMGWSQRGTGYNYDSLNGYCALIEKESGKVLDYECLNRKCKTCDEAVRKQVPAPPHPCHVNHVGSAKSMQAAGAVKLVTESRVLKEKQVEIGVLVGDNDSCCEASIREKGGCEFIKQSDMNHTTKGVGKQLYEMKKNLSLDPNKELTNDVICHIQRCFSYAVKQNVGDLLKIKSALLNIPEHLFNNHTGCKPDWCASINEKNKENYEPSFRIESEILYQSLKDLFQKLSENAHKFISAASSQANESLNRSMCSKAPKNICYSLSNSCNYRFAATCAQKNVGQDYRQDCLTKVGISWSENLKNHSTKTNKTLKRKREYIKDPKNKKRRLDKKADRGQLKYLQSKKEGNMYKSNMVLFDNFSANTKKSIQISEEDSPSYETENFAVVFFDLETGSTDHERSDILQISMKCGRYNFNCFVTPKRGISSSASNVNGFTKINKKLYQNGKEVYTIAEKVAFLELIDYLKLFNKKCILVAHNCSFDQRHLINKIEKLSLIEEFSEYVEGFSDSLSLFRKKLQDRPKDSFKLTTLASDLLCISPDNAHDANYDVFLLETLALKYLDVTDIVKTVYSITKVLNNLHANRKKNQLMPEYAPMIKVIKSHTIIERIAKFGVSYPQLVDTFQNKSSAETEELLSCRVDGKATGVKTRQVMDKIINYLKTCKNNVN